VHGLTVRSDRLARELIHHYHLSMNVSVDRQYRGYAVCPSAHRMPDGCFSSNLMLERFNANIASTLYEFYSLDYFASEDEALRYSRRWARNWIDTRG